MTTVLIVSENRKFLKNICEALVEYENIVIKIVNYSTSAFDAFVSHKPDVIIIDSLIMIPLHILLNELKQCRWPFSILIYGEIKELANWKDLNIKCIEKKDLQKVGRIILDTKTQALSATLKTSTYNSTKKLKSESYFITPEYYHILISKYVGHDNVIHDDTLKKLNQHIDTLGNPEIFNVLNQDIIIAFKQSDIKISNALDKVHSIIKYYISPNYVSIYAKKIRWDNVNSICMELLTATDFCYFFHGESVNYTLMTERLKKSSFQKNIYFITDIFTDIIKNDIVSLKERLANIYLHNIKATLDNASLRHFRDTLTFANAFFSKMLTLPLERHNTNYISIENEFEDVLDAFVTLATKLNELKFSDIVSNAMIYSFQHYGEELSLQDIAKALSVSKMHLSRVFKLQTHMTYLEFLQGYRLFIAKELLINDQRMINEIAAMTGYEDSRYFSKMFKKNVGISPKEYRSKHQNGIF